MNAPFDPAAANPTQTCGENSGCCEGVSPVTPVAVENPARQPAIAYRVGTHSQFLQSMRAGLSDPNRPALQGLTTRDPDSFSLALLDGWATVADVLTFYQERIANESYLNTATENKSVLELSRLIGYRPRPGVAASTDLAFTLEDMPGSPEQVTIGERTKVQSIPGPDEKPQVFETVEKIEARVEWNAIRPCMALPQVMQLGELNSTNYEVNSLCVQGANNNLKAGDLLLISDNANFVVQTISKVTPNNKASLTHLEFVKSASATSSEKRLVLPKTSSAAQDDAQSGIKGDNDTTVTPQENKIEPPPKAAESTEDGKIEISAFRQSAALFGHNAAKWDSLPWKMRYKSGRQVFMLICVVVLVASLLVPCIAVLKSSGQFDVTNFLIAAPIFVLAVVALWAASSTSWEGLTAKVYSDGKPEVYLDNVYPRIVPESYVILRVSDSTCRPYKVKQVIETTRSDFGLSAKVSRLTLETADGLEAFPLRGTMLCLQQEGLGLTGAPISDAIKKNTIKLNEIHSGIIRGCKVVLSGESREVKGTIVSEVATVKDHKVIRAFIRAYFDREKEKNVSETTTAEDSLIKKDITELTFEKPLSHNYLPETVRINANVAKATHGESVQEILGSGNPLQANQRFILQQQPLTYVLASTPEGCKSTLEIRVNGIQWHERQTLLDAGKNERVFVTSTDDAGVTTVEFGDGEHGARVPSGSENVTAKYRVGIGQAGLVQPGQLSQLMTRPFGVKGVSNPLAASGGADPEAKDEIRDFAPASVQTLNRLVSFSDYRDFARAFPGVAKADAQPNWDGSTHGVFLTIAGPNGSEINATTDTYRQLDNAFKSNGDPRLVVTLASFKKVLFNIAAKITVNSDFEPPVVLAAVKKKLAKHFSFPARRFGQNVARSEVIAVIQNIPGVISVQLEKLTRTDGPGDDGPILVAAPADAVSQRAAELLILDETSLANVEVGS